jgi:hypothetical protein
MFSKEFYERLNAKLDQKPGNIDFPARRMCVSCHVPFYSPSSAVRVCPTCRAADKSDKSSWRTT